LAGNPFSLKMGAGSLKKGAMNPLWRKKGVPAKTITPKCTDQVFLRYRFGKYQEIPTEYRPKIPNRYTTLNHTYLRRSYVVAVLTKILRLGGFRLPDCFLWVCPSRQGTSCLIVYSLANSRCCTLFWGLTCLQQMVEQFHFLHAHLSHLPFYHLYLCHSDSEESGKKNIFKFPIIFELCAVIIQSQA
jgi:hypothetical protein